MDEDPGEVSRYLSFVEPFIVANSGKQNIGMRLSATNEQGCSQDFAQGGPRPKGPVSPAFERAPTRHRLQGPPPTFLSGPESSTKNSADLVRLTLLMFKPVGQTARRR